MKQSTPLGETNNSKSRCLITSKYHLLTHYLLIKVKGALSPIPFRLGSHLVIIDGNLNLGKCFPII